MKIILLLAIFTAELHAQTVALPIPQHPIVGFIAGPGPLEITPIEGVASTASFGAPLTAPEGTVKLYLPPRQQYALIEQQSSGPIAVWNLQSTGTIRSLQSLVSAFNHADVAVFSPRGSSAALYSSSLGRVQIVTGLPGAAVVKATVSSPAVGAVSSMAVTDDGAVVVVRDEAGEIRTWSGGSGWRLMPWNYNPLTWSFVPESHDLAIGNSQAGVLLFHDLDGPISAPDTLISGDGEPVTLAVTTDGEDIIDLESASGIVRSIQIKTASIRTQTGLQGHSSLLTLRDGHTFFVSTATDSSFCLLKVSAASATPVLLTHPGNSAVKIQGERQ